MNKIRGILRGVVAVLPPASVLVLVAIVFSLVAGSIAYGAGLNVGRVENEARLQAATDRYNESIDRADDRIRELEAGARAENEERYRAEFYRGTLGMCAYLSALDGEISPEERSGCQQLVEAMTQDDFFSLFQPNVVE